MLSKKNVTAALVISAIAFMSSFAIVPLRTQYYTQTETRYGTQFITTNQTTTTTQYIVTVTETVPSWATTTAINYPYKCQTATRNSTSGLWSYSPYFFSDTNLSITAYSSGQLILDVSCAAFSW